MTDQKIYTTQDMLDDHYEEVEALHREIAQRDMIIESNNKRIDQLHKAVQIERDAANKALGALDLIIATAKAGRQTDD